MSPKTYYELTDENKTIAAEKNINLELSTSYMSEDRRLSAIDITGNGDMFLSNDGTYKSVLTRSEVEDIVAQAIANL